MRYIIDEEWSIGNFSDLFPPHHPFPVAVTVYLVGMVDELKDEISTRTEGQMKKANITYQEESKEMLQHADDASTVPSKVLVQTKKENIVGDQGGKDTRRTKYAVGAVGGAVGDGIVAAVVGSVQ